jgi:hypothetical protein
MPASICSFDIFTAVPVVTATSTVFAAGIAPLSIATVASSIESAARSTSCARISAAGSERDTSAATSSTG